MGKTSAIEWCDATHNFWYGCTKVSEGCAHCFAEREMKRFGRDFNTITRAKGFDKPLHWKESKKILIGSWMDFFHEDVPDEWRKEAWEIMYHAKEHTFMILTKRPENMKEMLPAGWTDGMWKYMPNVWLGVSVENQDHLTERIIPLFQIPATVRFVSAEPLLGPIDFKGTMPVKISHDPRIADDPIAGERIEYHPRIDWIITGGESGSNARPMNLDWARDIRDQCITGEAKFFHKQHGGSKKINGAWGGREFDGRTWDEFPDV